MQFTAKKILTLYFVSSIICSLSMKYQLMTYSPGKPDSSGATLRKFSHPWFQVLVMFFGESMCLLVYLKYYHNRSTEPIVETASLDNQEVIQDPIAPSNPKVIHWILILPSICDLTASTLSGFSTMWIDLSAQLMLGGLSLVFVSILTRVFLKRQLNFNQMLGIIVSLAGFVMVSLAEWGSSTITNVSNIVEPDDISLNLRILGIIFIVITNLLAAFQSTFEEYLLKEKNLHPLQTVGCEGIFGSFFATLLIIILYFVPGPVQPNGKMEDIIDVFVQFIHSPLIIITTILFFFTIPILNFTSQSITKALSALDRSLLSNFRTLLTWIIQLFVYYIVGKKQYGESLDGYSLIKADGFLLMVIGALLFNVKQSVKTLIVESFPILRSSGNQSEYEPLIMS